MTVQIVKPSEQTPLIPAGTDVSDETLEEIEEGQSHHDDANQSVGRTRAIFIILSLWILIFLQAANMSGLTTTQGMIAGDLNAYAVASWFTSSYLIAMSSMAPLAGKLSQIFSPRNLVFLSACLFGLGGLVTSRAQTFAVFIVGRVISGVGGAGILTISIILVLELTSKKRRGLFIGLLNAGYTSGVALGAMLAGALAATTGWRVLFAVQTPLALIAGTGVFFSIPKSFVTGTKAAEEQTTVQKLLKIDYIGAITLTSTIVLVLYGLASPEIQWIPILISLLVLPVFILNEIYFASNAIIPVTVLSSRGVLCSCVAQVLFMASRWTVLFYTPVFATAVKGWTPAQAGSILVPTNVGFALGGLLAGWLHIKRSGSFYLPTLATFALFVFSLFTLSNLSVAGVPSVLYLSVCFINGFFTGASLNYTLAQVLHLSPASTHFIVSSLLATFRGFAGSFGSAIGAGIFGRTLKTNLERGFIDAGYDGKGKELLIKMLLGSPRLVQDLVGVEKEVAIRSYEGAVKVLFGAASICALLALLVQAAAGWKQGIDKPDDVDTTEELSEEEDVRR